jgi:hypothetical protein
MSKKSERLELRADQAFIDKIQELADEDGVTKAEIVRRAVGLYSYAANLSRQGLVLTPKTMNEQENATRNQQSRELELATAI